ncbi:restriction endonuclease subunit S [Sediminibacterium salmoneum]|uniref:restriction endonuclease subunit S n=1 Tax=Sediminibacterium salmoneum TaxID=426421 RepID=UPI0004ACC58A|nr:restriction endonuclease subunit S [Sediminibacterium salmoneum]
MRLNYKPLGKYIQPVVGRNNELGDLPLVGLSIQKKFIPSIANTIGTDMSTYRIIERNQFAYGPVTSRNGEKITIALFNDFDKALISQAYVPFEVKDSNELNPEYLMMWFRRPEFDRYARFKSHGSAREIFDWEEMSNTLLPIPHIDKQREIVKEYNTIQNRIDLNQKLIQKLEETAQAIYKEWFVEFEFPDENGKPYKSNGGGMNWCEELGKEIPKGWKVAKLRDVLDCNPETISSKDDFKIILYLDTSNITNNRINELQELDLERDKIPSRAKRKVKNNDIIFSTVRPALRHYGIIKNMPDNLIVSTGFAVFRANEQAVFPELVYSFLTDIKTVEYLQAKAEMSVSTYPSITSDDIINLDFTLPQKRVLDLARNVFKYKDDLINLKNKENQKLTEMKALLLSRLVTVEN